MKKRLVSQYDLEGKLLQVYSSVSHASDMTEIPTSNISKSCSGRRITAGGFIFLYAEDKGIKTRLLCLPSKPLPRKPKYGTDLANNPLHIVLASPETNRENLAGGRIITPAFVGILKTIDECKRYFPYDDRSFEIVLGQQNFDSPKGYIKYVKDTPPGKLDELRQRFLSSPAEPTPAEPAPTNPANDDDAFNAQFDNI